MKNRFSATRPEISVERIRIGFGIALALTFLNRDASANEVLLGTANNFAVLAASAITSTDATIINGGDVGLSPNSASSITGFPPATISTPYTIHAGDAVALQAQNDLTTAYNAAVGLARTATLTGTDLGGLTLTPGVYFFATSAQLTGTLTLNDQGNPDAVFVFQIGSTLITAADSAVVTINDPSTPGVSVFWQVGSSATLGTSTDFEGNILAYTSITDDGGSTVDGRLLAMGAGGAGGAITLDDTTIDTPPAEVATTVPENGRTFLLFSSSLLSLFAFGRQFRVLAPATARRDL